jgi:hypothetical protein
VFRTGNEGERHPMQLNLTLGDFAWPNIHCYLSGQFCDLCTLDALKFPGVNKTPALTGTMTLFDTLIERVTRFFKHPDNFISM